MDFEEHVDNPFAIDDFWRESTFAFVPLNPHPALLEEKSTSELIRLDCDPVSKTYFPSAGLEHGLLGFRDYAPLHLETIDPVDESSVSSHLSVTPSIDDEGGKEDIWALGEDVTSVRPSTKLLSWDTFFEPRLLEPPSAYLSEYGPKTFDAVLAFRASEHEEKPGRLAEERVYLRALLELALGRNSHFFRFDRLTQTFLQDVEDISVSGVSLEVMENVIREFVSCGSNMKILRSFVHDTTVSYKASPAIFSLASAISIVVFSLEAQLQNSIPSNPSLLQLYTIVQRSGIITKCLVDLVASTKLTETDEELVSIAFKKCERLIWQHEWLSRLLHEIVLRVADPWLTFVEEWIGLRPRLSHILRAHGDEKSFVKTNVRNTIDDDGFHGVEIEYEMKEGRMPSFIDPEHGRRIFEYGQHLRLLSDLQPEHPILRPGIVHSDIPSLRWTSSWIDLEAIQAKADAYERDLRLAILQFHKDGRILPIKSERHDIDRLDTSEMFWWAEETLKFPNLDESQRLSAPLASTSPFSHDMLYEVLSSTEWYRFQSAPPSNIKFSPPFAIVPMISISPTLSAQCRLIDFSVLHLLFTTYSLSTHLALHRRYHLFGDGVFISRLSQSLFDPEQSSADRHSCSPGNLQAGSSTGLRLGNRSTWPPAHSELRLVLMGLLTETYFSPSSPMSSSLIEHKELPGSLSFAVRDLSDAGMEACQNPHSIKALDFLRLQYKAPRALTPIITPSTLHKYDRIFKQLLRLLRMQAATHSLTRSVTSRSHPSSRGQPSSMISNTRGIAQRFRRESHHFISTLLNYSLAAAIDPAWSRLESKVNLISRSIEKGDIDATINHAGSLSQLQTLHEHTLNQIIDAMFLTKSQKQVRTLLEEAFDTILAFAKVEAGNASGGRDESSSSDGIGTEENVRALYATFRGKVVAFLRFLRGVQDGDIAGAKKGRRRNPWVKDPERAAMGIDGDRDGIRMRRKGEHVESLLMMLDWGGFYGL